MMAVDLKENRVAKDRFCDLAAAGEAQLAMKLSGVIEAEDPLGLPGEEIAAACKEAEMGVTG